MRTAFLLILCLGSPLVMGVPPAVAAVQEAACPECKKPLKPDAKFCGNCGAKIEQRLCAGCKAPLKPGAKFCPGCGMKVEDAPAPKPESKPETAPEPGKKPPELQEAAKPQAQLSDADSVKQKLD